MIYFIIGSVLLLTILTVVRKFFDRFVLIAVAICCGVNAIIYPSYMKFFTFTETNIIFPIDTFFFIVFFYCILMKYLSTDDTSTRSFIASSFVAIGLSALTEMMVEAATNGANNEFLIECAKDLIYGVLWLLLSLLSVEILKKFRKKLHVPHYISIPIVLFTAYGLFVCITYGLGVCLFKDNRYGTIDIPWAILGSLFVAIYTIVLVEISYLINYKLLKPNDLKLK